ncbi:MAG TPA: SusC/RagA family TonB-linked outer membrane protein, partial [Chitinophagaceae bacterium]
MKQISHSRIGIFLLTTLLFLITQAAIAQTRTITGKVIEAREGKPLEGVSILVNKTGTQTKADGSFSIEVPTGSKSLSFSFVGYKEQTVAIGSSGIVNVSLEPVEKLADEVVVIGYGVARKTDVTSAISSIKEKDFNKGAIISPMSLVQGKVPGLVVVNSNGSDPNGQSSLQLRGITSLKGSTSPFVVIDGIPGGNLNNLSPEDVESIDVLRDGSAAAIYGTRGSNGVIIITTKRSKAGTASFNYDSYVYTDMPKDFPGILSAEQYRDYAAVYKLTNPTFVLNDGGANTNWFKKLTRNTVSQVHNFSFSSGTDKSSIRGAVSVRDLQGMAIRTWRKIVNTRLSFTQKALDNKLAIQGNIATSFLNYLSSDNTIYGDAMDRNPTFPVFNPNGTYFEDPLDTKGNPYARRMQTEDGERIKHLNGSIKATLDIVKGLKASGFFAFQRRDVISYYYQSRDAFLSLINGQNGNASRSTSFSYDRTFEYTLDYAKRIGKDHQVTALAGYSYQDFMSEDFNASNRNFLTDAMSYNNLGAGQAFAAGTAGAGL